MQNEFDKYKNSEPEVFFLYEFSPLSDRKKGLGECNSCQGIFLK
jgi:hypothetical protein